LFCAQQIERKFEQEQSGICDPKTGRSEIGALYIEPVQGTGGYIAPPGGYFVRLARLCRDFGILIVADEIQMGFFRTGRMWSAEHLGIEPDIIVFGKSLTNGLNPLSGLWAREDLLHPGVWPPGSTHSTFAANPMGTAAGVEVMKILTQQDYATSVCAKGAYLVGELQVLQRKHKALGFVHGIGLAVRLEICAPDGRTPDPQLADRLFQLGLTGELEARGRRYGLILGVGGPCKSTLTLAPSLNISEGEIDLAIELLDRSLEELGG
jgi:4-aminobutyrate aminotransferase-like enzyme